MSIVQLTYGSCATEKFELDDLYKIVAKANKTNQLKNVSGLLVFHENCFYQILEGEEEKVNAIFDKIKNDPRHHDVKMGCKNYTDKRLFEDHYGMSLYYPSSEDLPEDQMDTFEEALYKLSYFSKSSTVCEVKFFEKIRDKII